MEQWVFDHFDHYTDKWRVTSMYMYGMSAWKVEAWYLNVLKKFPVNYFNLAIKPQNRNIQFFRESSKYLSQTQNVSILILFRFFFF